MLQRAKCASLAQVKNLNLWGNDLSDVSILQRIPNLEVCSLSVNRINTLKDFSNLVSLRELYLRKNEISDLDEVRYLQSLPNLQVLWLADNPIAERTGYKGRTCHNPIAGSQKIWAGYKGRKGGGRNVAQNVA